MKTLTRSEISNIIYFFNGSAYCNVKDIETLASIKMDETHGQAECEEAIFCEVDCCLEGYYYVECEGQKRHIWHSLAEIE